jgi:hypothetical protein
MDRIVVPQNESVTSFLKSKIHAMVFHDGGFMNQRGPISNALILTGVSLQNQITF